MSLANDQSTDQRFHEIVERDNKRVPIASNTDLAVKILLVAPVWMVTVLPLTVAFQVYKSIKGLVRRNDSKVLALTDDGKVSLTIAPEDIVPRSDRKYDVVLLGATGFTGGLAVRHLVKTYGGTPVKYAIAGRSEAKLKSVLKNLADELKMPNLVQEVDTIICDTSDPETLHGLVKNTKSVATTAGPFSLYGEPVVEFCANYGTHYTDITGETSFVKRMKSKYEGIAVKTGARIISLCGNDCVPWDLSYNLLADEFSKRGKMMESVEFGNEFASNASGGTLKTMCLGISGKLADVDDDDADILRRAFGSKAEHTAPMENKISLGIKTGIPKPWKLAEVNANKEDGESLVEAPFVMSGVNYECIGWSHALRKDSKCSYKEQLLLPNFQTALDGVLGLFFFFTSLMNPVTGGLLENYLVTQPGDGPEMKAMQEDYFCAITGTAKGSDGSVFQSLLYYNKDPGYLETARMVVECALCLALEEDSISQTIAEATNAIRDQESSVGGFFTPGFALRKNLLKRLVDTGCYYDFRVVHDASGSNTVVSPVTTATSE